MVRQCWVCKKLDYLHPNLTFHRFPADDSRRKEWLRALDFQVDTTALPKHILLCSNHFEPDDFVVSPHKGINLLKRGIVPQSLHPKIFQLQHSGATTSINTPTLVDPLCISIEIESEPDSDGNDLNESSSNGGLDTAVPVPDHIRILKVEDAAGVIYSPEEIIADKNMSESVGSSRESSSDSTTDTASETEEQIMLIINDPKKRMIVPERIVGPESGFKGKLSLVTMPNKERQIRYVGDITVDDFSTPTKTEISFGIMKRTVDKHRKTIKYLRNTVKQLRNRVTTLNNTVKSLKEEMKITKALKVGRDLPCNYCFKASGGLRSKRQTCTKCRAILTDQ